MQFNVMGFMLDAAQYIFSKTSRITNHYVFDSPSFEPCFFNVKIIWLSNYLTRIEIKQLYKPSAVLKDTNQMSGSVSRSYYTLFIDQALKMSF